MKQCGVREALGPHKKRPWVVVAAYLLVQAFLIGADSSQGQNDVMEVRSGRELAVAFATSNQTCTALLLTDVWMREADWEGLLGGSGNSEPIMITRNFSVIGSPSLPSWPLLNLGFVRAKIRIASGVTLIVHHVVIGDFRSNLITQAPGFDLAAPSFPGSTPGRLLHNETAVLYEVCFPAPIWAVGLDNATRASTLPGNQTYQFGFPQTDCLNTTVAASAAARSVTAATDWARAHPPSAGLTVQPPLQSRCWADRGQFIDVAVVGADVDNATGTTVPNHYDVLLQRVTYLCLNVMSMGCIRQYGPLLCSKQLAKYSDSSLPWRLPSGPGAIMEVRTGRDMAIAFASVPRVRTAVLMTDVWVTEADWHGLLGGPNGTEPALVSQNFTVQSDPELPSWPLLNMNFVRAKVRIASAVTLMAHHLVIGNFRSDLITQAPGFDLAARTAKTQYDHAQGILLHNETAVLYSICFPALIWRGAVLNASRASSLPGRQTSVFGLPQTDCINATTSSTTTTETNTGASNPPGTTTAAAAAGGGVGSANTSSPLKLQPPLQYRCWADRGEFTDVAVVGADVDATKGTPVLNHYDVLLQRVTYLCLNVMSMGCIGEYGPLLCSKQLVNNTSTNFPWSTDPTASMLTPSEGSPSGGGGGGGSDDKTVMIAVLAGVLGGVALLALLAVAGYLVMRHRGRFRNKCGPSSYRIEDPASAKGSSGSDPSAARLPGSGATSCWGFCGGVDVASGAADGAADGKAKRTGSGLKDKKRAGSGKERGVTKNGSSNGREGQEDSVTAEGAEGATGGANSSSDDHTTSGNNSPSSQSGGDDNGPRANKSLSSARQEASTNDDDSARKLELRQERQPPLPPLFPEEDEHVVVTPLTPPRPDLQLGEGAIEQVTLLPVVLGKGAFGRVYEGMYMGHRVAVKVMRDMGETAVAAGNAGGGGGGGGGACDHVQASFAQEVEVLGRCQHPNVVRLLAACLTPPRLLLVMELMQSSLEKLVYKKPVDLMPLTKVLHIAIDIAKGLEYLHPTILHRDLKPANILINEPNSERPIAKITDFGVSRLRSTVLITKHPEAGTPAYMAPETFDVKNYTLTHHVDIYSFGVVLWVCLTGEHPWRGLTMVELAYKVTINRQRLPLDFIPEHRAPPLLRALIAQCWEHEPRRRPAAAEVVKVLQAVLDMVQQ